MLWLGLLVTLPVAVILAASLLPAPKPPWRVIDASAAAGAVVLDELGGAASIDRLNFGHRTAVGSIAPP